MGLKILGNRAKLSILAKDQRSQFCCSTSVYEDHSQYFHSQHELIRSLDGSFKLQFQLRDHAGPALGLWTGLLYHQQFHGYRVCIDVCTQSHRHVIG